ncbi:hypothetical protein NUM3379_24150 [Kineococcus sp. NUM-3379]
MLADEMGGRRTAEGRRGVGTGCFPQPSHVRVFADGPTEPSRAHVLRTRSTDSWDPDIVLAPAATRTRDAGSGIGSSGESRPPLPARMSRTWGPGYVRWCPAGPAVDRSSDTGGRRRVPQDGPCAP